jgi:hypothetical protein
MKRGIMKRGIAEILGLAAKEKKNENKVAVLTMNDSPQLRKVIKYILDPQVVWWEFLKGSPAPYKPNRYLDAEGRLFQELRILYMFVESGDDWMGLTNDQRLTRAGLQRNPKKREKIWIQLLESITPEDAELLCFAPRKEFPFKGLNLKIIEEAFPGLLAHSAMETPLHGLAPQVAQPRILSTKDIIG